MNRKKVIGLACCIIIACIVFGKAWKNYQEEKTIENMKYEVVECAAQYGLESLSLRLSDSDPHQVFLYCSNFFGMEWELVFEMHERMESIKGLEGLVYCQGTYNNSQPFYIYEESNEIHSYNKTDDIVYSGGWDSVSSENRNDREERVDVAINAMKDAKIKDEQCDICGVQATKRIEDEYYCDKHYEEALEWYIKKVLGE